jgi:saccharopine dehydrogenase-like NADP-dependent oxidoreductase
MRILVVGAGGVGEAVAAIARRRDFFEQMVLADLDVDRAAAVAARMADPRISSAKAPMVSSRGVLASSSCDW